MTIKEIKAEKNYLAIVAEAKALGVKFSKVKKEDLRTAVISARRKADKGSSASKKQATTPAVAPVAIEIEKKHIKAITGLKTKKEKVLALVNDFNYPVAVAADAPGVKCHPTNAHAILRAAGCGRGTNTVSEEVKEQIRGTVLAKIAANEKAERKAKRDAKKAEKEAEAAKA